MNRTTRKLRKLYARHSKPGRAIFAFSEFQDRRFLHHAMAKLRRFVMRGFSDDPIVKVSFDIKEPTSLRAGEVWIKAVVA